MTTENPMPPQDPAQPRKKMRGKWWKIPLIVIGGFFTAVLIGAIIMTIVNPNNTAEQAAQQSTETPAPDPVAESEPTEPAPETTNPAP